MQAALLLAADLEPWTHALATDLTDKCTWELRYAGRSAPTPQFASQLYDMLHPLLLYPTALTAVFRAAVDRLGLRQDHLLQLTGPLFTAKALASQLTQLPDGASLFATTWPVLELFTRRGWQRHLGVFQRLRLLDGPPPAAAARAAAAVAACSALDGLAVDAAGGGVVPRAVFRGLRCGASPLERPSRCTPLGCWLRWQAVLS